MSSNTMDDKLCKTIEELYQWAKENNATNLPVEIFDCCGNLMECIEPRIFRYGGGVYGSDVVRLS